MRKKLLTLGTAMFLLGASISVASAEFRGPISRTTQPAICDVHRFVTEVECIGSSCDKLLIKCEITAAWGSNLSWMPFVSEEQGWQNCPAGHAVPLADERPVRLSVIKGAKTRS